MKKIQPVGGFFPMDEEGFVLNPCRHRFLQGRWRPLVQAIVDVYREEVGEQLHSVWIRGSLARGLALSQLSDVDSFALVTDEKTGHWQRPPWVPRRAEDLRRRFPFFQEVELIVNGYSTPFEKYNPRLAMVIATQSLCIYGEDLVPRLPRYRPGPSMMLQQRYLAEDVKAFAGRRSYTEVDCREITKVLLRAGFELVMERIGQFTPDLYWCYEAFARYYPGKAESMRRILHYYLNPVNGEAQVRQSIIEMGAWLIQLQNSLQKTLTSPKGDS